MTTITSAINLGSFTNTEVSVHFSPLLDILTSNIISELKQVQLHALTPPNNSMC